MPELRENIREHITGQPGRKNVPAQHVREEAGTQQLRPEDTRREERRDERRDEAGDSAQDQTRHQNMGQEPARRAPVLNEEWQAVQYEFVDDPQAAVRRADELVTRALEDFATRQRALAKQLTTKSGDGTAQTEDLRLALHKYRELFQSLVTVK